MPLSPEELQRIREEEEARHQIRKDLEWRDERVILPREWRTTARPPVEDWSPGVAGVLSFVIPGAGQIYKGKIAVGLLWFVVTVLGYVALIVPGLILHVACVVNAASARIEK